MNYRNLGKSGLKVSSISIGAWLTYGESVDDNQSHSILNTALDHGVNFIDVADVYGHGRAEIVVGNFLKSQDRSNLVVSSKVFWPMSDDINDRGLSRKHILQSIDKSLQRLQTDYLDIYFCHRFDDNTPLEETIRAMDDLIHQGKILYWGTSVWESSQIKEVVKFSKNHNLYPPQVEQPRYNLLDRHIEKDIIPTGFEAGMGFTVWSPLAEGILTGKYNNGIPEESRGKRNNNLEALNNDNIQKTKKLSSIANDLGITVSQIALAWILRKPEISSVITGATKESHIITNVEAINVSHILTDDILELIEEIFTDSLS